MRPFPTAKAICSKSWSCSLSLHVKANAHTDVNSKAHARATSNANLDTNANRATTTTKIMPFGYYLENRTTFLEGLRQSSMREATRAEEEKVMSILQNTGSSNVPAAMHGLGLDDGGYGPNRGASTARDTVTIRQMLACSMHLGHATSRWHPKMAPYIFGERAGIHIINLERTLLCLRQACQVTMDVASKGGVILFVGTSEPIQRLTYECAQDCKQYYVNRRWLGGTITNRSQVLRNDKLLSDLLIVLDPAKNQKAIVEAYDSAIPTITICDTNMDPSLITYPIPANDDAYASVELVARTLSLAAAEGAMLRGRTTKVGEIVESATLFIDRVFEPGTHSKKA